MNFLKANSLKILFFFVLIISFIYASWYVSHGDISFQADSARDFNLLREIDEKKFVLIGPRASGNLFHGPLWLYMNYPAFALGQGNPITVGWSWVLLWAIFTLICFLVADDLFGQKVALVFTSWATLYFASYTKFMINPHGAMVLVPLYLYFLVKYLKTLKVKFLIFFFLTIGAITNIEIAIGTPIIILSFPIILMTVIKKKKLNHLLTYAVIPLMLSNFIIFDLRHDFLIFRRILEFISPKSNNQIFNYLGLINNRMDFAFSTVNFITTNLGQANLFLFLGLLVALYFQIKANKDKLFYTSVLYFYFGFFVLSFIDKGPILYFYVFPLSPLLLLAAASLVTTRYKLIIYGLFLFIMGMNIKAAVSEINTSAKHFGESIYSWKFLEQMSKTVFRGEENEFGYFVYAPDAFAYDGKYAMYYQSRNSPKKAHYFKKMPVTYVVAQPPPPDLPYMTENWWIENQVKIKAKPISIKTFSNGYKIYKYNLSKEETEVSFDPAIDPGITFR